MNKTTWVLFSTIRHDCWMTHTGFFCCPEFASDSEQVEARKLLLSSWIQTVNAHMLVTEWVHTRFVHGHLKKLGDLKQIWQNQKTFNNYLLLPQSWDQPVFPPHISKRRKKESISAHAHKGSYQAILQAAPDSGDQKLTLKVPWFTHLGLGFKKRSGCRPERTSNSGVFLNAMSSSNRMNLFATSAAWNHVTLMWHCWTQKSCTTFGFLEVDKIYRTLLEGRHVKIPCIAAQGVFLNGWDLVVKLL